MCKGFKLVLFDDVDNFSVNVQNFPLLPIGSSVTLDLGKYVFESLEIESYHTSNTYGTLIFCKIDANNPPPGAPTRKQLKEICKQDSNLSHEYLFPTVIDFG